MTITRPLICTFALLAGGCSETKSPQPQPTVALTSLKMCTKPPPPSCPFYTCGGNSPVINAFPINGVRSDGECNLEGVQLVPDSLSGGLNNLCNGSTLDVRDNKLIGLRSNGTTACEEDQLKNATFVLRSHVDRTDGSGKRTLTVQITDIQDYTADNGETRKAYRMNAGKGPLCNPLDSSDARVTLGLDLIPGLSDPPMDRNFVIPVTSELYDRLGHAVPLGIGWERKTPDWLHLACVDDALAKRSLYDLYSDSVEHSRAALMMLVANYCGNLHVTMRGVYVAWQLLDDSSKPKHPVTRAQKSDADVMLEAEWGPEGAVCVSEPRLLYRDGPSAQVPTDLPADLANICPSNCAPDAWANALRECDKIKPASAKPGYVPANSKKLAKCDACGAACKGRRFHSYVVPGPQ